MKQNIPLSTFVKYHYPTHSNYIESLQVSDKFKDLTFDTFIKNNTDREKSFRKKMRAPTRKTHFLDWKAKN